MRYYFKHLLGMMKYGVLQTFTAASEAPIPHITKTEPSLRVPEEPVRKEYACDISSYVVLRLLKSYRKFLY